MGILTRDAGDSLDQTRPATYAGDLGSYRMLPSLEVPDAWHIYPELADFPWRLASNPGYLAIPQHDPTHGYIYSFAVHRLDPGRSVRVGYAANLLDMCWPVERDLIAIMGARPADLAAAA